MAHFAELDENNKVLRVLVVDNSQEHRGEEFLAVDCGLGGRWIQTSYNSNFRGMFAGVGGYYDEAADRFYPSEPYPSWTLNRSTWQWEAPTPKPTDGQYYEWVEDDLNWQVVVTPAE